MKKNLFQTSRILLLLVIVFTSFNANSQTAYEKLFWKGYNPGDLESVNLDGSNRAIIYPSSNTSFGLEVDVPNDKMYWYDLNTDNIMRSNLDGSNAVVFVPGIIDAQGLSIDFTNHKLYWCSTSSLSIQSINLDGTGLTTFLNTSFVGVPECIKIDVTNQKLYWFDHNAYQIKRINLDGTGEEIFITNPGNVLQIDIDEEDSKLYWPNWGINIIESINLDGTGRTTVASGFFNVGWPQAIALDKVNGKIYWWDADTYVIKRINTNGTNLEVVLTDVYSIAAMIVAKDRGGILPLTLLSFTGKEVAQGVYLEWKTADEINTAGFDIERSLNGTDFVKIGSVAARTPTTYSYTDSDPISGVTSFYRLKMRDVDNKFTYSTIVSVKKAGDKVAKGYLVYPNPVTKSYLYIKPFGTNNQEDVQIAIVDISGRTWYTQKLTAASLSSGRFEVPVKKLPHGVYVLRISDKNGEQVQATKFTVGD